MARPMPKGLESRRHPPFPLVLLSVLDLGPADNDTL